MHTEWSHGHLHLEGLCLLYCSTIVFLGDLIILKNEVCVFIFHWAPQVSQSYKKSFQRQAKVSKKQNNCKGAEIKEWLLCINFHSWQRYSHAHTFVCTTQCSLLTWLLLLFPPFFFNATKTLFISLCSILFCVFILSLFLYFQVPNLLSSKFVILIYNRAWEKAKEVGNNAIIL